jgi:hypothetical protein
MKTRSRRTVAALVLCFGLIGIVAAAVTAARAPDDTALAQGLRSGGFVIVVRHGPTFADIEDGDLLNLDSCSAQSQRRGRNAGKGLWPRDARCRYSGRQGLHQQV